MAQEKVVWFDVSVDKTYAGEEMSGVEYYLRGEVSGGEERSRGIIISE